MIINEIFHSIQGEGRLAGVPSVFIRTAGCPIHCKWCDTKYAWDPLAGQNLTIEQIIEKIAVFDCDHIVITGGEPMLTADIAQLLTAVAAPDRHITIETAGVKFIPGLKCDLMSISPKLSNSVSAAGMQADKMEVKRLDTAVLRQLIDNYDYQFKFVVDSPADLDEIAQCLEAIVEVNPYKVFLMPQAVTRKEYIEKSQMLAEICKCTGFALSPRLQVLLWDNEKGR